VRPPATVNFVPQSDTTIDRSAGATPSRRRAETQRKLAASSLSIGMVRSRCTEDFHHVRQRPFPFQHACPAAPSSARSLRSGSLDPQPSSAAARPADVRAVEAQVRFGPHCGHGSGNLKVDIRHRRQRADCRQKARWYQRLLWAALRKMSQNLNRGISRAVARSPGHSLLIGAASCLVNLLPPCGHLR
jgi:hypothetical protein